ncbi:SulP family inorganic anion transporter [Aureispira anguillae]|uniref:Sulfate permease n=1 Tax=Aureispira anguillae TaxID=2864201 RepID=A0A915Y9Z2_9BACT|nr:sulfate permease [Aureispira anguillae]BDS09674.1 sulfate permease [Aureispira anguillae]
MKLKGILPILDWLPNYNKKHLKGDISAGLTVGIMLIPQGMAYAMLAGMPPIYGLYAALIPQFVYAILGTSRQLGVGPVAMDSLLVAVAVSQFAQAESDQYIALVILLAMIVGGIQLLMGFLRLGFLVNFLSHPVISGFTSAAALLIGFSQLKYLMGVDLERSQFLHEILWSAFQNIGNINPYAMLIGLLGMGIIISLKKRKSSIPAPLVVVVLGIIGVWSFGLDAQGVAIVKTIPKGLPSPSFPILDWNSIQQLMGSAFTLALVGFMEAIAISKAIHVRHNDYKIVPNQELIALGMANIMGAIFQSFPTTGGFSRSAVNDQAGAKTNLAALISATFIVVTLLFLTPLFYYLPKAVLASIIMVAVFKLVSVEDARLLWEGNQKRDFAILMVTFVATLTIGIQKGILLGVIFSIINMLYDTMYPHITLNQSSTPLPSGILIIRFEEQLYFANSAYFREKMEALLNPALDAKQQNDLTHIIFDASSIPRIDSTGQKALDYFIHTCQNKNYQLSFVGLPAQMDCSCFESTEEAIKGIQAQTIV